MIIFLNGTSSSGKSALARKIMRQSERPFLYFSIDHLLNFWIDEKFVAFEDAPKEWLLKGNVATHIDGPNIVQLHWDMIESLAVLIQKGYDLIIDEVLWQEDILMHYVDALCYANKVYIVKVICELMESERRESKRPDRFKGLARELYTKVYQQNIQYDFDIDTTTRSPERCAEQVLQYVELHTDPKSFKRYLSQHITFTPLQETHFTDLYRWLNAEHIRQWWGEQTFWTHEAIQQKYESYVKGYKVIGNVEKPIHAYIIECANKPIGYIQFYDVNDFPRTGYELAGTSQSTAGMDMFIGEPQYLKKNLGEQVIEAFLVSYIKPNFAACFVDPETANVAAIRTYEKCGFKLLKTLQEPPISCYIKQL